MGGKITTLEELQGLATTVLTAPLTGDIRVETRGTGAAKDIKIKDEGQKRVTQGRDKRRLTRRLNWKKDRFTTTFLIKGSARTKAAPKNMVSGIALHSLVDSRRRGSAAIG